MERFLWKKRDSQSKLWLSLIERLPPVAEKRWRSGNLLSRLTWMYPLTRTRVDPTVPTAAKRRRAGFAEYTISLIHLG